jgi:integrase
MNKTILGLYKRYRTEGDYVWCIDKRVKRFGRLCESTGTADREEAERYLLHRLKELREILVYGERPRRAFREAVAKYLADFAYKKSIAREAAALKNMDPFIGHLTLDRINNDSFVRYRRARRHLSVLTRNQKIAVARRILRLTARVWCYPGTNLTWLERTPEILMEVGHRARKPYPLDESEQSLLFGELAPHLSQMASFAVNTGVRDQELCGLEWAWERHVATGDMPTGWRSVFVLPAEVVKGGESQVVILNDTAQAVLEGVRGQHGRFVFVSERRRVRLAHLGGTGWQAARRRAARRYRERFGVDAPEGFRNVRVHALRHTFGRRLWAAGVSLEDRRDLLGHKAPEITTHYSAAEVGQLVAAANRIVGSRGTPTPTLFRL